MNRLHVYREFARARSIPEHVIDRVQQLARPRWELRPAGHSHGPVVGRYRGQPALPDGVERPDLEFIASVDCAALPSGALDIPMPQDGSLLFFANTSEWQWADEDRGGRVVYVPAGATTAEPTRADGDDPEAGASFPLHGHVDWNMPGDSSFDAVAADRECEALFDKYGLVGLDDSSPGELTLGGYACPAWDDPCLRRWPDDDGEPWLLLAQASYTFPDKPLQAVGFWMIRRRDLADGNFDDVKYVMDVYS